MRVILGVLACGVALGACKTNDPNNGSAVRDIESVRKVTLVQGNDGSGNAVGVITCADGFIDSSANKTEFAVPWNKVKNKTYAELEAQFCTEQVGDNGPGPGPGPGPQPGEYSLLDTAECESAEGVDLPLIRDVKRVYLPSNMTDTYDRCVLFGVEFEAQLKMMPALKQGLVTMLTRVYAHDAETFAYDEGAKKLTVPVKIKNRIADLITVAAPIFGNAAPGIRIFESNRQLVWKGLQGPMSWGQARAGCAALGEPWKMPTQAHFQSVRTELKQDVIAAMLGTASGNTNCCYWIRSQDQYTYGHGSFSSVATGNSVNDLGGFCVIGPE